VHHRVCLKVITLGERQVRPSWRSAADRETGIVAYKVFRDGAHLATVKGRRYQDNGEAEGTKHSYEVSAVNYHGVEGARSLPVTTTTSMDCHGQRR
jgi:hypothetical protein